MSIFFPQQRRSLSMKSNVYFYAECKIRSLKECNKTDHRGNPLDEKYWTVYDDRDVCYFIYKEQTRVAELIKTILPAPGTENEFSIPVRLEGYVTQRKGTYLCLLRCLVWNSDLQDYEQPPLFRASIKDTVMEHPHFSNRLPDPDKLPQILSQLGEEESKEVKNDEIQGA